MTRLTITLLTLLLLDPTPAQAQVNEQDALAHDNTIDGPDRVSLNAKIAFVSLFGDDGKPGIYVINPDGSNATRLASGGGPIWSPDGTKIAFVSPGDGSNAEIYVINADGSSLTNLTNHPATEGAPSWSPDGTKIAFVEVLQSDLTISVMNADGSNQTRLGGQFVFTMDEQFRNQLRLTWSPDGSTLAFTGCEDIMDPRSNWDIYSVDLDGKLAQLTSNAGMHMYVNPVWSPLLK